MPTNKKEFKKYYAVRYKNRINMYLDPHFAIKQKLDVNDLKIIKNIHRKRLRLFDIITEENDPVRLRKLAQQITEIEYTLQEAWGFNKNINFHSWWFMAPKCHCPIMDNQDSIGTNYHIITTDCPLHGSLN